jgi:acyl-CoA synthetase (AMP-forming)/AMP-acid ligase II
LAYRDRHRSVTYREFDRESNRVAHGILALDDDRPIVLVAPVSIATMAVVFGSLKAGRMVAPLDPRWPVEQWLEVAHRTRGRLVVPDEATRAQVVARGHDALVAADLDTDDESDPRVDLDREAAVFLFFTSGSTGAPKGIVVGHAMAAGVLRMFEVRVDDRLALLAPRPRPARRVPDAAPPSASLASGAALPRQHRGLRVARVPRPRSRTPRSIPATRSERGSTP